MQKSKEKHDELLTNLEKLKYILEIKSNDEISEIMV